MKRQQVQRKAVSKKEARGLLQQDSEWVKNDAYSKLFFALVFLHPDGRVLTTFPSGNGVMYSTREAFEIQAELIERTRGQKPQHILHDRLPGGEEFPQYAPHLVDNLATLLKIPGNELDNSLQSLDLVEHKIKHLGRKRCLDSPIFAALVAYIGEVIRRAVDGRWVMILSNQDDSVWEPWIIDPQGRSANSFSDLYDMLAEPSKPISIRGATAIAINSRYIRKLGERD